MDRKATVMFLCTGNSCRSQMAEGFARTLGSDIVDASSAGIVAYGLNPRAVKVMREIGVDISGQTSDVLDPAILPTLDYCITLCGNAEERCPLTPQGGVKRLHWPFEDPTGTIGSDEDIMVAFRKVRDGIRTRVSEFLQHLRRGKA
ncbi:MAG: arsenate reductase ArsC [Firmicutes bacterium]|nr:arsenate reductase ArsC [Bacillota bacterium]